MNGPQLADYEGLAPEGSIELLRHLADELAGRTFIHVNSTKAGGGVAEILNRMVPLMEELGIRTRWEVIEGTPAYYEATKQIHNTLQGARMRISDEMWDVYLETSRRGRGDPGPRGGPGHDPRSPAGPARRDADRGLALDLALPHRPVPSGAHDVELPRPVHPPVRRGGLPHRRLRPTAAHPLLPDPPQHRSPLGQEPRARPGRGGPAARRTRRAHGSPPPGQVSRFDRFKDPLGVIEAYRLVRRFDDCALVLAGGGAADDPEGAEVFARVQEAAAGDPNIHILMLPSDAHLDINALQRGATAVVQKSVKEGFGLTVAEAMWKGKPVVGGAVGGIAEQIQDGVNGYLVHSIEGCAHAIRQLLGDRSRRQAMGEAAREQARRNALITRHLSDYLQMLLLRTKSTG